MGRGSVATPVPRPPCYAAGRGRRLPRPRSTRRELAGTAAEAAAAPGARGQRRSLDVIAIGRGRSSADKTPLRGPRGSKNVHFS